MANELASFLAHYGVLGMKWGRRRGSVGNESNVHASTSKTTLTPKGKVVPAKETHIDAQKAHEAKAKVKKAGLDSLSNQELQSIITRTNLEQQYSKLNPAKQQAGKKFVTNILANTGKQVASQYASEYAKKGVSALINSTTK